MAAAKVSFFIEKTPWLRQNCQMNHLVGEKNRRPFGLRLAFRLGDCLRQLLSLVDVKKSANSMFALFHNAAPFNPGLKRPDVEILRWIGTIHQDHILDALSGKATQQSCVLFGQGPRPLRGLGISLRLACRELRCCFRNSFGDRSIKRSLELTVHGILRFWTCPSQDPHFVRGPATGSPTSLFSGLFGPKGRIAWWELNGLTKLTAFNEKPGAFRLRASGRPTVCHAKSAPDHDRRSCQDERADRFHRSPLWPGKTLLCGAKHRQPSAIALGDSCPRPNHTGWLAWPVQTSPSAISVGRSLAISSLNSVVWPLCLGGFVRTQPPRGREVCYLSRLARSQLGSRGIRRSPNRSICLQMASQFSSSSSMNAGSIHRQPSAGISIHLLPSWGVRKNSLPKWKSRRSRFVTAFDLDQRLAKSCADYTRDFPNPDSSLSILLRENQSHSLNMQS